MFLKKMMERNPRFIRIALELHRSGRLPPTSYLLDFDTIRANSRIIKDTARRNGLGLYPMTKQIGRNPIVAREMVEGTDGAVAVDIDGARSLHGSGIPVGHAGHLLQIPNRDIPFLLGEIRPEVVTVSSVEKARQVARHAKGLKRHQNLMLRIADEDCFFYRLQEGGFNRDEALAAAREIGEMDNVDVTGVTTFPTMVYDPERGDIVETPNLSVLTETADALCSAGFDIRQINCPGSTASAVMPRLKARGATHVEPGHGFAGMTPLHAFTDQPELPAVLWVSEVSHIYRGSIYIYGWGFKPDVAVGGGEGIVGLVGDGSVPLGEKTLCVEEFYQPMDYIIRARGPEDVKVGDTVIFAFRQQIAFSVSNVGVVKGSREDSWSFAGLFDRTGNPLER